MSTLNVAIVVFGALTALFMLGGGVGKVTGQPAMRESAQHFAIRGSTTGPSVSSRSPRLSGSSPACGSTASGWPPASERRH